MVTQGAILERLIEPQHGGFSPEHARYVLSLDLSPADHARYAELSVKAQNGTLTAAEQGALDDLLAVNALLMILQSKARVSLKRHTPAG